MKSQESKIQQAGDMLSDAELLYLKKTCKFLICTTNMLLIDLLILTWWPFFGITSDNLQQESMHCMDRDVKYSYI